MSTNAIKTRLDALLVRRGLFESRSQAAASVIAGDVCLGPARRRADKPGMMVSDDVELSVDTPPRYVSRGGLKLERALQRFELAVTGRRCLDVGASTGGFTDCLLQHGATRVVALDVAYGALHWRLRNDPRVTVIERRNAREIEPGELPYKPELITIDLSFIGLAKVLPAVTVCTAERFDLLALVKPQFELGRGRVGKGGVVSEGEDRLGALLAVTGAARGLNLSVVGFCDSGLPGPAGNREYFIWCAEPTRSGLEDFASAAREALRE